MGMYESRKKIQMCVYISSNIYQSESSYPRQSEQENRNGIIFRQKLCVRRL